MLAFMCDGLLYTDLPGFKRDIEQSSGTTHEFSLHDLLPDWTTWFTWAIEEVTKSEDLITVGTATITDDIDKDVQPFFFDYNGDTLTDVLYSADNEMVPLKLLLQKKNKNGTREWDRFDFDLHFTTEMKGICKTPDSARRLANPHYNSYQDVNGDCIPDLLLTTFNEATN